MNSKKIIQISSAGTEFGVYLFALTEDGKIYINGVGADKPTWEEIPEIKDEY